MLLAPFINSAYKDIFSLENTLREAAGSKRGHSILSGMRLFRLFTTIWKISERVTSDEVVVWISR